MLPDVSGMPLAHTSGPSRKKSTPDYEANHQKLEKNEDIPGSERIHDNHHRTQAILTTKVNLNKSKSIEKVPITQNITDRQRDTKKSTSIAACNPNP